MWCTVNLYSNINRDFSVLFIFWDAATWLAWEKNSNQRQPLLSVREKRVGCLGKRNNKSTSLSMPPPQSNPLGDICPMRLIWSWILTLAANKRAPKHCSSLPGKGGCDGPMCAWSELKISFQLYIWNKKKKTKRKERLSPGNGRAALDNEPPVG